MRSHSSRDVRCRAGLRHHPAGAGSRLYRFKTWNPRDFTDDAHRTVDDRPYGGGPGMLMLAEPMDRALNAVQQIWPAKFDAWVCISHPAAAANTPAGDGTEDATLNQNRALVLLCGRYEA